MTEINSTDNQFSKKTRNKYLYLIMGLTVFNIIAFTIFRTGNYDVHGNYLFGNIYEKLKLSVISFLFSFPILSLFIALIAALFPYRQLEYRKKYFRSFLLTLRFINILFAIGLVLLIIMTIFGWYPPSN